MCRKHPGKEQDPEKSFFFFFFFGLGMPFEELGFDIRP